MTHGAAEAAASRGISFSLVDPPGVSILTDGVVSVWDDSTPNRRQRSFTSWPAELESITVN